jgi:hypothetical protein
MNPGLTMSKQRRNIKPKEVSKLKAKASKSQHKHDDFQDLEAKPSKNKQTRKAEYIRSDKTEIYYYGACPECGKEGQLKNTNRDLWSYCEVHKTAWIKPDENDYWGQGIAPGLGHSLEAAGYRLVRAIKTRLETPENKAAILEEMQAASVTRTSEIHLVDQKFQYKECYGLNPLPDGCTVQVRFREFFSYHEHVNRLKLIKDEIENSIIDFDDIPF